ncbi:unnamed protein product [Caenorhabditis brenneri]
MRRPFFDSDYKDDSCFQESIISEVDHIIVNCDEALKVLKIKNAEIEDENNNNNRLFIPDKLEQMLKTPREIESKVESIDHNDSEIMLRNQKYSISNFMLSFENDPVLSKKLHNKVLVGREKLKYGNLEVEGSSQQEILKVLSHIDSVAMEVLHIEKIFGNLKKKMDLELELLENALRNIISDKIHYSDFLRKTMCMEDPEYLEAESLTTPHHRKLRIKYKLHENKNRNGSQTASRAFGASARKSMLNKTKQIQKNFLIAFLYWISALIGNRNFGQNESKKSGKDQVSVVLELDDCLVTKQLKSASGFEKRTRRNKLYPTLPLLVFSNPCIMKTIMKNLSYFDISSLRKVATGPRNCILNLKPKGEIKSLELEMIGIQSFCLKIQDDKKKKEIYYANTEDGCFVNHQLMEGDDIQSILINDLSLVLSNQKGCLEEFRIEFLFRDYDGNGDIKDIELAVDELLEAIRTILHTRSQLLKVKTFIIEADTESKVSGILQYLDPESLKTIEINSPDYTEKNQLETKNLSCLEQWKSASEVSVNDISVMDFNDFLPFRNVQILADDVTAEAISELKMKLLNSSNFNKFKIYLKNGCDRNEIMYALLDPPQQSSQTKSIWMFRIEDSNDFLQIICNWNQSITFSRVRDGQ